MKLRYLSQSTVDSLRAEIGTNLARYQSSGFEDVRAAGEWDIELDLDVDLAPLKDLDPAGSSEAEVRNSRLVWRALGRLSPSLAYEEGVWVRLTHCECLQYCRSRWLSRSSEPEKTAETIATHFFADTLTKRRDDNAISRLWWNAYIARKVSSDDHLDGLPAILKTADIRSNIVERRLTASRTDVCAGIVRLIQNEPRVTESEERFRKFMKVLNLRGGGVLFEVLTEAQVDAFLRECVQHSDQ